MGEFDQGAKRAYEAIAPVYDTFTENHDFGLWLGNLLPAIERHSPPSCSLLDVACGTGKSFLPMLKRGWSVTACDVAPAMVARAEAKIRPEDSAEVVVADMRALPQFGEFGVVWCLTDALNYLLTEDELDAALAGMVQNLHPEGLLAFDVNTLLAFQTFFAEEIAVDDVEGRMIWTGHGSPTARPGSIAEATFRMEAASSTTRESVPAATHRERHFPEATVLDAFGRAGAECVDVFGINYDAVLKHPLIEDRHTKAVYLARKI
jgi:SAM-dependent methyltransferase